MNRSLICSTLGLLVMLAVSFGGVQSAPAGAPGESVFGVNSHSATRYPNFDSLDVPADVLAQAETGWVREDFQFHRMQPQPGQYDWGFHDEMVDQMTARGINIIGVLNGPTPGWATLGNPANDFYPPNPQQFAEFAGAVVARYKDRVRYWEVWNEPDNARYWKPAPNAAAYATLLKAVYPAIKAADPRAQVLAAGLVSPEPATSFLQTLADNGAWGAFDIISIHPYTDPRSPEEGQIAVAGVGQVRALAERLGAKPIWATEYGWSTGPGDRGGNLVDAQTQANYLVRGAVLLRAAGVERVLWYNLKDTAPDAGLGLLGFGGGLGDYSQPKPSYTAFRTLNQQLAGAAPAGLIDLGQRNVVQDFENFGAWSVGAQKYGTFTQSSAQVHSGSAAAQLSYNFPGGGNDFVVFQPGSPLAIPGSPGQLGIWVYGDGSGHALKVWLRDSQGEVLQFRLGFVGSPGWQFLAAPINGSVESFNRISGGGNLRLDFPVSLTALVLDDEPDSASGGGTIYLDDLTAVTGPAAYGARFARGSGVVDVLWAPETTQISLPTQSGQGTRVEVWGETKTEMASGGQFTLAVGANPIFLSHVPGQAPPPPPQPQPQPQPGDQRCFEETGYCIFGRIRAYWEQNGGLPVFGYPISPQQRERVEGQEFEVQWFERNRLELHPENAPPYDVLLGRLGEDRLLQLGRVWQEEAQATGPQPGCLWFEQTRHNVCDQSPGLGFKSYWESHGLLDPQLDSYGRSLALFGLPLTEPQMETNSSGDTVLTQWFERARFEWHPNNPDEFKVLLGRLGAEVAENP